MDIDDTVFRSAGTPFHLMLDDVDARPKGHDDSVEVSLKPGGWRRLGTDDPHGLVAAPKRNAAKP